MHSPRDGGLCPLCGTVECGSYSMATGTLTAYHLPVDDPNDANAVDADQTKCDSARRARDSEHAA
jgi:hypothetical protein